MSHIVLIGSSGRMSLILQTLLREKNVDFKVFSPKVHILGDVFHHARGVIDFSLPEVSKSVSDSVIAARIPWVCGTTGWASDKEFQNVFGKAASVVPVVADSNFSLGIEMLCQMSSKLAEEIGNPMAITDIHHSKKRDTPSGTALKIEKRMKEKQPQLSVQIDSIRLGDIPGEHHVLLSLPDETLEIIHRASSRRPFAEGAYRALQWAVGQKPGLYSMRDLFHKKES